MEPQVVGTTTATGGWRAVVGTTTAYWPWWDPTSTPLVDLRAARREIRAATGREGTDLHLSMTAALALSRHPSILALLKYTDPAGVISPGIPCVLRGLVVRVVPVMKDAAILGPAVIGGPSDRWFLITGVDAKPSLWLRLRHRLHPGNTPQQRVEALSAGLPSNPPRGRHG